MSSIWVDMTMSLDGHVTGPDDGPDEPMGSGGFRLFNWLDKRNDPGPSGEVYAELMATRALISGRRTYELAGRWGGDHHNGVPIFVLTHKIPDEASPGTVRYCTDVAECAAQARTAVGDGVAAVVGVAQRRYCCVQGRSTSCNCTSSRYCSVAVHACSSIWPPNSSNSNSSARYGPATWTTQASTSCICCIASGRRLRDSARPSTTERRTDDKITPQLC